MEVNSPRVRALLRQARKTEESGKRSAAEQLYRQVVDEEPRAVEGWLGLARVGGDEAQREEALERVRAIDPQHAAARAPEGGVSEPATEADEELSAYAAGTMQDGVDPFSVARSWLEEATARPARKPQREVSRDGAAAQERDEEPPVSAAKPSPQAAQAAPAGGDLPIQLEEAATLTCYRHPDRKTGLRCITCNRPICIKCAKHTPVGYRCPNCIREAQEVFFSATLLDYAVVALVTLALSALAGMIAPRLGFFVIFIGPAAGTLIGRAAFRVARRRHGRYLPHLVAILVAIGGLLPTLLPLLLAFLAGVASPGMLGFGMLWPLVYVFLATGSAYYQVK